MTTPTIHGTVIRMSIEAYRLDELRERTQKDALVYSASYHRENTGVELDFDKPYTQQWSFCYHEVGIDDQGEETWHEIGCTVDDDRCTIAILVTEAFAKEHS